MISKARVVEDPMSPGPAQRMASVVQPGRPADVGDELPLLWHWAYFPDLTPTESLGLDGHPRRADPWAGDFPRRVAGGGHVRQLAPFLIGTPARRRSELVSAKQRTGGMASWWSATGFTPMNRAGQRCSKSTRP